MLEGHPSAEDFALLLCGTSRSGRPESNAHVIRHLLSDCSLCRDRLISAGWSQERLARLFQPAGSDSSPESNRAQAFDYERAFAAAERAVSDFLTTEPLNADKSATVLFAELEALPAQERIERAKAGEPFATPRVVRSLVDRSHSFRYQDASEMLHFALLAKTAAESCSAAASGNERRLADLRARAWGQYGNALRVCSQPMEAMEAFATAQAYRDQGTGDPALRAWLIEKLTPLFIFQGRFREAIEICEEAGQIYQDIDEPHLHASTLIQKAIAALYAGEVERATQALNQAIPLIDHEENPHLLLAACNNLIRCYIDLDRPEQALMLYDETRELYQEFNDPLILLRTTWQEGVLLRDLGHLRAAEASLLRVRKGYLERELAYEVALVSLDLASVYVKLGLVAEVKQTVMATVPIFHSLRVKLETLAALLQLRQVADQEQQALELIRSLNSRLQSLPKKPAK